LILISFLLDPPPGSSVRGRDVKGVSEVVAGRSEGFTEGILLVVGLTGSSWGGVQAPPGLKGNLFLPWLGELEKTSLFGNNCALMLGGKLGNELGDKLANLLWVEVTMLLRNIDERREDLVVALLDSFLENATSSTDLDRELLTARVTNKLAGLLLHVLGCARRLIHSLANLGTLTVAHLLNWCVALPHSLVEGLLLEGDGTGLLKSLLAHFLLGGGELGDIGVVALLSVLVGALKDWVLLDGRHCLLLVNTAQPSFGILLTAAEVDSTWNDPSFLPPSSSLLIVMVAAKVDVTGGKADDQRRKQESL